LSSVESFKLFIDLSIDALKVLLGTQFSILSSTEDVILSSDEIIVKLDLRVVSDVQSVKLLLEIWEKCLQEVENFLSTSNISEVLSHFEQSLDQGQFWVVLDF